MKTGRTLRLILRALIDLSNGHDVMFVGIDIEAAKRIAIRACQIAKGLKIPCANVDGRGPQIRYRAYDDEVKSYGRREKVHIDHAAVHEKGSVRMAAIRSIIMSELHVITSNPSEEG